MAIWKHMPGAFAFPMDTAGDGAGGGGSPGATENQNTDPSAKNNNGGSDNNNSAGAGSNPENDGVEPQESQIPENLKGYFQKLRKENADRRSEVKTLKGELASYKERLTKFEQAMKEALGLGEGEEMTPEQQIQVLNSKVMDLEFRNAILETAALHGIPHEHVKYFSFLVQEASQELNDGEELSEEKMSEIVAHVKSIAGSKPTSTGVGSGSGSKPPKPQEGKRELTLEDFRKMTVSEKSRLYANDRATYERLAELDRRTR